MKGVCVSVMAVDPHANLTHLGKLALLTSQMGSPNTLRGSTMLVRSRERVMPEDGGHQGGKLPTIGPKALCLPEVGLLVTIHSLLSRLGWPWNQAGRFQMGPRSLHFHKAPKQFSCSPESENHYL